MSSSSESQQATSLQHYFSGIPVVTKLLFGVNCTIYLLNWIVGAGNIHNDSLAVVDVLPPRYELSRMLTYAFVHMSFLHILMNMMTLLQLGSCLEQQFGSVQFLFLTAIGLVWVPLFYVLLEWSASVLTSSGTYLHTGVVGYSGVLFLYAVVEAFHSPAATRLVCGMAVPSYLYPFLMLFALQILVPGVSFMGHISGVFVGLLVVSGRCACFFPSQAAIITHFESPDCFLYELVRQLPSYIPVNTSQPEGFVSESSTEIESSILTTSQNSCSGRCQEHMEAVYSRIRDSIHALFSYVTTPTHEYDEVSSTDVEATRRENTTGRSCSDTTSYNSRMEEGIAGGERAEESTMAEMVRRGEKEDIRAIRLAKFANIAS